MGEKGEGSGGEGGGKWGERGRELGMGYPPVHPLLDKLEMGTSLCYVTVTLKCQEKIVNILFLYKDISFYKKMYV